MLPWLIIGPEWSRWHSRSWLGFPVIGKLLPQRFLTRTRRHQLTLVNPRSLVDTQMRSAPSSACVEVTGASGRIPCCQLLGLTHSLTAAAFDLTEIRRSSTPSYLSYDDATFRSVDLHQVLHMASEHTWPCLLACGRCWKPIRRVWELLLLASFSAAPLFFRSAGNNRFKLNNLQDDQSFNFPSVHPTKRNFPG